MRAVPLDRRRPSAPRSTILDTARDAEVRPDERLAFAAADAAGQLVQGDNASRRTASGAAHLRPVPPADPLVALLQEV